MKKTLFTLLLLAPNVLFGQTKIEQFCLDNGLEIVSNHDGNIVAKFHTNEASHLLTITYSYDFEALYYLTKEGAKLTSVRNVRCSNNGVTISMTEYRGGFKENITKKSWQNIVDSVNKKCQGILDSYNSYVNQ